MGPRPVARDILGLGHLPVAPYGLAEVCNRGLEFTERHLEIAPTVVSNVFFRLRADPDRLGKVRIRAIIVLRSGEHLCSEKSKVIDVRIKFDCAIDVSQGTNVITQ